MRAPRRNLAFIVLIELLAAEHAELEGEGARAKYTDLVVKCLIKLSKTVGETLTVHEETNSVVTVRASAS